MRGGPELLGFGAIFTCGSRRFAPQFAAIRQHRCTFSLHTIAFIVTLFPLLLASAPASVENRQAKERTARKACLNGDYVKGVSILSDLFVDTKDPTYIFNQGRCFEQNRRYEDAVARFEEYLRTNLDPQNRASGEKHLSDCQSKLTQERESTAVQPAPVAAPPPVYVPVPVLEPAPKAEPASVAVVQPTPPLEPGQRRWGLITAGIVTASLGVGGLVTGLVCGLKANNMVSDWESKPGSVLVLGPWPASPASGSVTITNYRGGFHQCFAIPSTAYGFYYGFRYQGRVACSLDFYSDSGCSTSVGTGNTYDDDYLRTAWTSVDTNGIVSTGATYAQFSCDGRYLSVGETYYYDQFFFNTGGQKFRFPAAHSLGSGGPITDRRVEAQAAIERGPARPHPSCRVDPCAGLRRRNSFSRASPSCNAANSKISISPTGRSRVPLSR
jgi:hypothetical protein